MVAHLCAAGLERSGPTLSREPCLRSEDTRRLAEGSRSRRAGDHPRRSSAARDHARRGSALDDADLVRPFAALGYTPGDVPPRRDRPEGMEKFLGEFLSAFGPKSASSHLEV